MNDEADQLDDAFLIELFDAAGRMGGLTAGLPPNDDAGLIELGRVADRVAETGDAQLTDPRLRAVWRQLMRRNRKDGRFLHPTEFDVGCGTADDRQRFAISMLLTAACEQPWTLMKRHERDALRDDLCKAAATLRTLVDRLQRLGLRPLHNVADWPRVDPLIVAADEAEAAADDLDRRVPSDRPGPRDAIRASPGDMACLSVSAAVRQTHVRRGCQPDRGSDRAQGCAPSGPRLVG